MLQLNKSKADGIRWVCKNPKDPSSLVCPGVCNSTRSVRYNSWFYNSKLTLGEIVLFTYFWYNKISLKQVRKEYSFSSKTVVDWASFCREVSIDIIFGESKEAIGGPGIIVEIDESKFGKSIN